MRQNRNAKRQNSCWAAGRPFTELSKPGSAAFRVVSEVTFSALSPVQSTDIRAQMGFVCQWVDWCECIREDLNTENQVLSYANLIPDPRSWTHLAGTPACWSNPFFLHPSSKQGAEPAPKRVCFYLPMNLMLKSRWIPNLPQIRSHPQSSRRQSVNLTNIVCLKNSDENQKLAINLRAADTHPPFYQQGPGLYQRKAAQFLHTHTYVDY
jgi:hypothetical protein